MKTRLLAALLWMGLELGVHTQGFININFEACTVPTNIAAFVSTSAAFPAWSVYRGGILQSQLPYNTAYPGESFLALHSTATSFPPLTGIGHYQAFLNSLMLVRDL